MEMEEVFACIIVIGLAIVIELLLNIRDDIAFLKLELQEIREQLHELRKGVRE